MEEENIIICEKCYAENNNNSFFCESCGAKLYKVPTGSIQKCKICKKEFDRNELMNGICYDCFENKQTEKSSVGNYKMSKIEENNNKFVENPIAKEFKFWATCVAIIGVLLTIIVIATSESFVGGIIAFSGFYVIWLLLRAVAEIIQLLEDIKNK